MKKIISSILATAILAVTLVGCSGGVKPNSVNSKEDLVGKTIGVQQGTTGDAEASKVEGATIDRYKKGADAIQALKQGKVDAVVIDVEPAKVFVAQNEGLKILETEYIIEDYAAAVGKDKPELMEDINNALKELIADGSVQKIIDKYIPAE